LKPIYLSFQLFPTHKYRPKQHHINKQDAQTRSF